MSKPWERDGGYGRREETRRIRDRFLIVCEGAQTEPNYFRDFRVRKDLVEMDVAGIGADTRSLVEEAIRRKEKAWRDRYALIMDRQATAIRNAKKLLNRYAMSNPEKDDPSTTFHLLVEALNEFVEEPDASAD